MNSSVIRYVLGNVLKIEGVLMFLPVIIAILYGEAEGAFYLLIGSAAIVIGLVLGRKPKDFTFYFKEGCVATGLSWIVLSAVGAIPFVLTGEIPHFVDALFETASGFTTTGASIMPDVEILCHASATWRCFTHWIGGMGVLVFLLAILPLSGGSRMNLMRAESPGPSVGKLVPKVGQTAQILYLIYLGLTVIEFLLLAIGGMPVFEAMNTSFATAGTGGFGLFADSFASYAPYYQWVVTVFMVLFGVNFNMYYLLIFREFKKAFTMEEVKYYILIYLGAVAIIMTDVINRCQTFEEALRHSTFTVASLMSTTGFATLDFNNWSELSRTTLVIIMFIGACAGSTGGGIKVSRIMIAAKSVKKELLTYVHPKSVKKIQLDHKPVEHEVIRATNVYLVTYVLLFTLSVILISLQGEDLITNFTAVAATFNNIGPGLDMVGPTGNYAFFNDFSKLVLIVDMLAGRLELFPMLILFYPVLWKDLFSQSRKRMRK